MIENERQYRITLLLAEKFRAAIRELSSQPASDDPLMRKLEVDALTSQLEELECHIRIWEKIPGCRLWPFQEEVIKDIERANTPGRMHFPNKETNHGC